MSNIVDILFVLNYASNLVVTVYDELNITTSHMAEHNKTDFVVLFIVCYISFKRLVSFNFQIVYTNISFVF